MIRPTSNVKGEKYGDKILSQRNDAVETDHFLLHSIVGSCVRVVLNVGAELDCEVELVLPAYFVEQHLILWVHTCVQRIIQSHDNIYHILVEYEYKTSYIVSI